MEDNDQKDPEKISLKLKNCDLKCKSQFYDLIDEQPRDMTCILCDSVFTLPTNEQDFLAHLLKEHHLMINDVENIASLKSYVRYWRLRLKDQSITDFCNTFNCKLESEDDKLDQEEIYILPSVFLREDKVLRDELNRTKLEWVLEEQVKERADTTFKRDCMFCRTKFSGSRIEYIKHLYQKHNILLGKPENLVFIDEFLDKIQNNIESLICIYCEKNFKNRLVLKEHMRKKLHKQVNPDNKSYDKYYITNYLLENIGSKRKKSMNNKKTVECTKESEGPTGLDSDNEDDDWSDWNNEKINVTCLFCKHTTQDFSKTLLHMKIDHNFDFENVVKDLTFYQKVKIVNYIRKQIYNNRCVNCDASVDDLITHMNEKNHCKLPDKSIWDQLEFYFPMFESDSFLYNLDACSDSDEEIMEK